MADFLTVPEAAKLLQVTSRTVINLISRGRFPGAYKIDPLSPRSTWRIPRTSIEAYIKQQQQPALAN